MTRSTKSEVSGQLGNISVQIFNFVIKTYSQIHTYLLSPRTKVLDKELSDDSASY